MACGVPGMNGTMDWNIVMVPFRRGPVFMSVESAQGVSSSGHRYWWTTSDKETSEI
jgi:hypothetical protein